jgi:hypothetical protein
VRPRRYFPLFTCAVVLAGGCDSGDVNIQCPWVRYAPDSEAEWSELPRGDIFEVSASMHAQAMNELSSIAALPLTVEVAGYYNDRYEPAPGKEPYLLRAAYGFAGPGDFGIVRHEDDVRVYHSSLGRTNTCRQSALVANIDFVPRDVYVEVFIAE